MPSFPKPTFPYTVHLTKERNALRNYRDSDPALTIPAASNKTLRVATWNIANLGEQDREDVHLKLIAEVISWFDIIAVQETKENCDHFKKIVGFAGTKYKYIFSDAAGNNKRMAFIFDSSKVKILEGRTGQHASALALQGSFHCGIVPVQAKDTADVLRKGITAMQAAQESGGDWCYYDPVRDTRMQRRYRLAAEVEAGLQRNEFRLAYQPRLCLPNAKIVSAEAQLRWTHPELGEIGPNEFIPVIESTMLMPVVTQWVMRQVMAQMKIWSTAPA